MLMVFTRKNGMFLGYVSFREGTYSGFLQSLHNSSDGDASREKNMS